MEYIYNNLGVLEAFVFLYPLIMSLVWISGAIIFSFYRENNKELNFKEIAEKEDKLKVINLLQNRGKANALHVGTYASKSEYLLCIDSDALIEDSAPYYLISHFMKSGERVGAVTGNPRTQLMRKC